MIPVGTPVTIGLSILAKVIGICIRENHCITYECSWWDGNTYHCKWLTAMEVHRADVSGGKKLGFSVEVR